MSVPYCETLNIPVPRLEDVVGHRGASTYALLIVALLERGEPMTLPEVARRFDEAGVAPADVALRSLKRCRPGRNPIYRDGDLYALDPHHQELGLWAFRLGLKSAKVPKLAVVRPKPPPLPGPDVPLSAAELEEAFNDAYLRSGWSAQRLAISVLDAHGGTLPGPQVVATLDELAAEHWLRVEAADRWGKNSPVRSTDDGRWTLDRDHRFVGSARTAVRKRIEAARKWEAQRPDPSVMAANHKRIEARREAHAAELAGLCRVLVHVFPEKNPRAVVLLDINRRTVATLMDDELAGVPARLNSHDLIAGVNVRAVLRALGFVPGERRLAELGPPQKTRSLNRAGRKLTITLPLLIRGSCGISRPLGDAKQLRGYLQRGEHTKLRRRLEADAKSLLALYNYGMLHGAVRLRWGFLDERLPAPWHDWDEPTIGTLMRTAEKKGQLLEVVTGSAPGWAEPWARARLCRAVPYGPYDRILIDDQGMILDEPEVQLARLVPR